MRPTRDETMLNVAFALAQRSTCKRRGVGCVLTDELGRILSTGHNGVAKGEQHCTDVPCPGADCPSGTGLDKCQAVHAEQNAIMFCPDVMKIHTCYVTVSPCIHCVKMLMNTGCTRIVFGLEYPHSDSEKLWTKNGRTWINATTRKII